MTAAPSCGKMFVLEVKSISGHSITVWTFILHHPCAFVNGYFSVSGASGLVFLRLFALCIKYGEAAAAASLHEFAKETFQTWQTAGIFARRRALNELRERAGFRLEAHRIGNYVAKTFDLMNEAQSAYARAQQTLFTSNVSYKIKPGLYARIASALEKRNKM